MAHVLIYSADWCPYCNRAKRLLESKGVHYEEINVDERPEERDRIVRQTGMRTIPQIFINNEFIGGFSELSALESAGQLDEKLGRK